MIQAERISMIKELILMYPNDVVCSYVPRFLFPEVCFYTYITVVLICIILTLIRHIVGEERERKREITQLRQEEQQ